MMRDVGVALEMIDGYKVAHANTPGCAAVAGRFRLTKRAGQNCSFMQTDLKNKRLVSIQKYS